MTILSASATSISPAAAASIFTTFPRIFSGGSIATASPAPGASAFAAGKTFGRGVATWIAAEGAAVTVTRALPE